MANVAIFLSTVTAEFRSYRDALRRDLDRPNVTVKVQEDFIATGSETLDKLDDYIRNCDAVIHLIGDMCGASAQPSSRTLIRERYPDFAARLPALAGLLEDGAPALSYTQWEAWLALYHGKTLLIAAPEPDARRDPGYRLDENQRAAQQAHLERLRSAGRYVEIRFANADRLAVDMLRSGLQEILARAGPPTKPSNLPFRSIGDLFKGRAPLLDALTARLGKLPETAASPLGATVLNGMCGVGKTRLAIEYAWWRADDYTALLFVDADSPASLQRNLAALCARSVLDLPEQAETDQGKQHDAVLGWLRRHPRWLLILDNIDSESAAAGGEALLPRPAGGHALLTGRFANWSGSVAALDVYVLSPEAAAEFLLARTNTKRRKQADDDALALQLAAELDGLALALEQAGAYIAQRRLGFAQYLEQWQAERDKVLAWYDPRLMQYPKSVAITWQTSVDQLGASARRLLERLAWLGPEPIPESLLNVAAPGADATEPDPFAALAELDSYSLIKRATDAPSFSVHRLVQEVARSSQRDDPTHGALVEALQWIDAAFAGDPLDVRDWPALEPLAPHARSVAAYADRAGIAAPTATLLHRLGALLFARAQHVEAEPLMRRALAIDQATFGDDHPKVAIRLNNVAQLLQATNRLAEAEPLMRRALDIDQASFGAHHPNVARHLNNLAQLLQTTNRLAEAEPLMRRALAIDEVTFGTDHPNVARDLNNLAQLLHATNRLAEAEPLLRRALASDEARFGADNPIVAVRLSNLAQLLQSTNRLAEAVPLMRRALAIDEASLSADHPSVAGKLNNLASLLMATNRLAEAEPLSRRALQIAIASLGIDHPNSQTAGRNYLDLLQAMGRTDDEIAAEFAPALNRS